MAPSCKTQYPILLVHGVGFRDFAHFNYWGRIPKALEAQGAQVFYGNQDSWGTIEHNAQKLKQRIEEITAQNRTEKVNIIAHSKGGLDARYTISNLQVEEKVASLTTIATPHNGSKTMDMLCRLPPVIFRISAVFVDAFWRLLKDEKPDFYKVVFQFTTKMAKSFNEKNPDVQGIYYQSYSALMNTPLSDIILFFPNLIVSFTEGQNDGLVTSESAKWTNFRGEIKNTSHRRISHYDELQFIKKRYPKEADTGNAVNVLDFYIDMVSSLREMGL